MVPEKKQKLYSILQGAVVFFLSVWIAAYAFLFNRRQALPIALICALACFLMAILTGFRFLAGKRVIPGNKCVLWGIPTLFSLLWILLKLNNSSIGAWQEILEGQRASALWGYGRVIRGDEWAVWTPMLISQAAQGYPGVNTAITAAGIDPTLIAIGGLPAWNPALVFKPFYWGFLLLGTETGFSMMTLLRFTGLAAVSWLCAMEYTRKDKALSVAAAFLITLSPYVQWWFSQSICEVQFFSQGIILSWMKAMKAGKTRECLAFGTVSAWCFGCFVMIAYPAWLIPVIYLTAAVMILMAVRNRKTFRVSRLLQTLAPLGIVLVLLFLVFRENWDTLMRIRDSAYPGQRIYTGGDSQAGLFTGLYSLVFPVKMPDGESGNASELANFLSIAPAGIILTAYRWKKTKRRDTLSAIFLGFIAFFCLTSVIPVPLWFAKATLLSQCTRPVLITGLCNLLLLLRALALQEGEKLPARTCALMALVCRAAMGILMHVMIRPAVFISAAVTFVSFCMYLVLFSGRDRKLTIVMMCLTAVIAGGFVNPTEKGLSAANDLQVVSFVKAALPDTDETVMAVEGEWPVTEIPLLAGMKCLNSTQPFADPERWKPVDPEGKWRDIYNRLCHISLEIGEETCFGLIAEDHIAATLTLENLREMGAGVLLTPGEYPELKLISSDGTWKLYQLDPGTV